MLKIKFILTALLIMFTANLGANAATIGYADFQKVISQLHLLSVIPLL